MALTKVSGPLLHGSNDNLGNYVINNITGAAATFTGNVSVGGTLTYDDVTNVESVGIVTAKGGLHVGAGGTIIYALSEDGGKIGINTTDASHLFTVYAQSGSSTIARFKAFNRNSNFDIHTDASSHGQAYVRNNIGAIKVALNSNGDSYFTGGDVGIGTNSPTDILDVFSVTDPTIRSRSGLSTVGANMEICGGSSNDSQLILSSGTTSKYQFFRDGSQSDDLRIYDSTNSLDIIRYRHGGYLHFGLNGKERVRINDSGYVGINTTVMSNAERLAVRLANDEMFELRSDAQELFQVWKEGSTEECRLNLKHNGSTKIHLRGNGSSYFNGGEVGINTTVVPYGHFAVDHGQYGLTRISEYSHILVQNKNASTTEFWNFAPRDDGSVTIGRGVPATGGIINDKKLIITSDGRLSLGVGASPGSYPVGGTARQVQAEIKGAIDTGNNKHDGSLAINCTNNNANLHLIRSDNNQSDNVGLSNISFSGFDGTDYHVGAQISAQRDAAGGDNDIPARLVFLTTADGESQPTERLRIDSLGRVGINTDTHPDTSSALSITNGQTGSDHCILDIRCNDNETSRIYFSEVSTSANGSIRYRYTGDDNYMSFYTNGSSSSEERLRITKLGHISIISGNLEFANGAGIDFSNVPDGSRSIDSDGNKLDDYEEGSFTPYYYTQNSLLTAGYISQDGKYTKIGRFVHFQIYLRLSSKSGGSGHLRIYGLPFTSSSATGAAYGGGVVAYTNNWDNDTIDRIMVGSGSDQVQLFVGQSSGTNVNAGAGNLNSDTQLRIFGSYQV